MYLVSAFEKAIQDTTVQILDVRTAEEYLEGHLEKASFLDLSDTNFTLKAGEMLDKDKKVAVYCRTGRRSKKAAQRLLDLGYEVLELDTGITGWLEEGLPVQH